MANGSRHSMRYVAETVYGQTPATPAFKMIRHTGTNIGLTKNTLQSEELRSDRQIADFRHGTRQVGGEIAVELSYGSFDDALEALLCGTWVPNATTGAQSLSAAVGSFARAAGSFITDGLAVNDIIISSGFAIAGNNGRFRITALTATSATVTPLEGQTMAVDAAAAGRTLGTLRAKLKAGTTRRSFSVLRHFEDLGAGQKPYHLFTGVEYNTLKLSVSTEAIVKATFGVVGKDLALAEAAPTGSTYAAATTTAGMDSFTGVLTEGGSQIAIVTEIELTLENGIEPRFVIGSKNTIRPSIGRSVVTGQITAYFEDATLLEKFINEASSSLEFELGDGTNTYTFSVPKLKYTGGQPDVQGEGPILLTMPFQAVLNAADATQLKITRNAP